MLSLERVSQDEYNDKNFSIIAPSSEELWVPKLAQMHAHGKGHYRSILKLQTLITPHLKVLCN